MLILRIAAWTSSVAIMIAAAGPVPGQEYPNKPIRIVTAAAGGGSDFTTRLVAQGISGPLGQSVVVENRGTGILAAEVVSKAPPDGYTLLVNSTITWTTPLLRKVSYDVIRDFTPICLIEMSPNVVATHPSMPVKSIKELIALAQARPGELNYGSSAGVGSNSHIAAELFKSMTSINIVHVPYKGVAPALAALLSGEVQLTFGSIASIAPHMKSGRLRALAVTSAEPSALVPDLPTIAATVPGFEAVGVTGISAPGKTPGAIIDRLSQEIMRLLNRSDVKERFLSAGVETVGSSPEQFAAFIKADMARVGKVIKDAGIKAD